MLVLLLEGDYKLLKLVVWTSLNYLSAFISLNCISAFLDKWLSTSWLNKFLLKTEPDLWSGRASFLLKWYYQREWEIVFSLYLLFCCSKLEEEEKKKNGKEAKEKTETEKVKREAVEVVASDHQSQVTIPPSLGKAPPPPPPHPSVLSDFARSGDLSGSSCIRRSLIYSIYPAQIWPSCLCTWEDNHPFLHWPYESEYPRKEAYTNA